MTLPKLTETAIRQYASAESFQRGRDYHQQGAVLSLVQRGTVIQAEVEGGAALPYIVHCTFDDNGAITATCTCPYDGVAGASTSFVNGVGEILDQAWTLIKADDGRNAITVLEAITEEYLAEWENFDDSDGEASDFLVARFLHPSERNSQGGDGNKAGSQICFLEKWRFSPVHLFTGRRDGKVVKSSTKRKSSISILLRHGSNARDSFLKLNCCPNRVLGEKLFLDCSDGHV